MTRTQTLGHFVPNAVLRLPSADDPAAAVVQPVKACVLFADLSGFTALVSERAALGTDAAEEIQQLLNASFAPIVEHVLSWGGDVMSFPGDAVVAVWCASSDLELEQAVQRAVKCAFELVRSEANSKSAMSFRVALVSGDLWMARVGGLAGRWHFIAGGSPFRELSRLLATMQSGEVALCAETRRVLDRETKPADAVASSPIASVEPSDRALRAFVPRSVQERIDRRQLDWSAEFRRASIMFVQFSGLRLEDEPPTVDSEAFAQLHEVMRATQQVVSEFDGEITELSVDDKGLVAVVAFGVVQHVHEDDARRCLSAALELMSTTAFLGAEVNIGIATDRVFTGVRGGALRKDFALIGNGVNIAARLMSEAGGILCDVATYEDCRGRFLFESLASIRLKGLPAPIKVFRPRRRIDDRPRQERTLGRDQECRVGGALVREFARTGRGGTLIYEGAPGIGKSHLLDYFATLAQSTNVRVLRAWCDPIESGTPYYPWRSVMDSIMDGDSVEAATERLIALVEPPLEPLLPLLNPLLRVNLENDELIESSTPQKRAEETHRVARSVIGGLAKTDLLLFVIDDLQWIDTASEQLVAALNGVPNVLFVGTRRLGSERLSALSGSEMSTTVRLGELDRDSAAQLLAEGLEVDAVPAELADHVFDLAGGSPLFTKQLAGAIRAHPSVRIEAGECLLADWPPAALELPSTITGTVTSAVDLLSLDEQLTLKVAAVIGREFHPSDIAGIHPQATLSQVEDHMRAAVGRDLLTSEESRCRFRHEVIRQAVYELLPVSLRAELHGRVGDWIEAAHRDDLEQVYALLAYHFEQAGERERAVDYLERAGVRTLYHDYQPGDAIEFFERLLAVDDGPRVKRAFWERSLGEALMRTGAAADAQVHLTRALSLLGRKFPMSKPRMFLVVVAGLLKRALVPPKVRRVGKLDQQSKQAYRELVAAYELYVRVCYGTGRGLEGLFGSLQALPLAERLGPSYEYCNEYSMMANVIALSGRNTFAERYERFAREAAKEIDEPAALAVTQSRAVLHRLYSGDGDVEDLFQQGIDLFDQLGDYQEAAIARYARSRVAFARGDFESCVEQTSLALEQARRHDANNQVVWLLVSLAEVNYRRGDYRGARGHCLEAKTFAEDGRLFDRGTRFQIEGLLALLALREQSQDASAHAWNAARAMSRGGWMSYAPQAGFMGVLEAPLCELKDSRPAEGTARQFRRMMRWLRICQRVRPVLRPLTQLYVAKRANQLGRGQRARKHVRRGLELAQELNLPFETGLLLVELAKSQTGGMQLETFELARQEFTAIGAQGELAEIERCLSA